MRYFLDSEFIEDGKTIDLISIALVCEDGRTFYCISNEFDSIKAWNNTWVRENVLKPIYLEHETSGKDFTFGTLVDVLREVGKSRATIADLIQQFLAYEAIANELKEATKTAEECYQQCEFWAYYADYDWIVFCQLFGTMMDLPKGLPMFCLDLKQWCYQLGNPELPVQESVNHNALEDALHNRVIWQFLNKIESNRNQYYKIGVS